MRDVIFVEVFAVVEGFEPKLPESFTLAIRADDAVYANKASKPNAVEAFLIKNGGCIADALGDICREIVSLMFISAGLNMAYLMPDQTLR